MMDLKPGRELDALVAEKVMGLKQVECVWTGVSSETGYENRDGILKMLPQYSTDIEAAWEVVEEIKDKVKGNDGTFKIQWCYDRWKVYWDHEDMIWGQIEAATAPHAICLAALKAVGAI